MTCARLVVGLGNPGREHRGTRHNTGFRVLEHLALREGLLFHPAAELEGYRGPPEFLWARSHDPDALLAEPETWMNASGRVVLPLARWMCAGGEPEPGRILVVLDDLDLALGDLRLRSRGSSGGHRGMESILLALGTQELARLRVGIGRPGTDAARHVLERFLPEELPVVDRAAALAADAILDWMTTGDIDSCVARFHSRCTQGDPRRASEPRRSPREEGPV